MRNTAWLERVRNYHGHHNRAAWSLLGYEPRYHSFTTKRRVTRIDSLLFGEGMSSEQVTVAVPAGCLIESNDRASASRSDSEPVETIAVAAGTSAQPRRAAIPSSSEEERMLRWRPQRFMAENLEALAFGDVWGEASDAPQHAGNAPAALPPAVAAETTSAPCLQPPSSSMTRPLGSLQRQEVRSFLPRSWRRDGQRRGLGLRPCPVLLHRHRHRPVRKHPRPLRRSYGDRAWRACSGDH